MKMPVDNSSETETKNLPEGKQTTRFSIWLLPETLRLGASVGLWTLAAVGLVLNLSALVCYFRMRRLNVTFRPPCITVAVNLCVNNLLLVVAILLAAVTLTFGHSETSFIVGGVQSFLAIHALLQSWFAHVLSIFYATSTVRAWPQRALETKKKNVNDIPDVTENQAGDCCDESLSYLQVRSWRSQASEGCRQSGEGDEPNISKNQQSRVCASGSAGPFKQQTARSLRWWLLWTWVLSLLSGTALLFCSAADDTQLSRTFNPFRRWYLVQRTGSEAPQQAGADGNIFFSLHVPVLLVLLSVYVAGSLIIAVSAWRLHTVHRLRRPLLAISSSAVQGRRAAWQHKVTPRLKRRRQQIVQSTCAAKNECQVPSKGLHGTDSSSLSSDLEESDWDAVSGEYESSCDITDTAAAVSTIQSLPSDFTDIADDMRQASPISSSLVPFSDVCQEGGGLMENKGADGVEEHSQEKGRKVRVKFIVGCEDGDGKDGMDDVSKQLSPLARNVSDLFKISLGRTTDERIYHDGEEKVLKMSGQNFGRCSVNHVNGSCEDYKQPDLETDARKEIGNVREEVDEHSTNSPETSTGDAGSRVLCNNANAKKGDKGDNEISLQNVNQNARSSPSGHRWSAERIQAHSNMHIYRRRHGSTICEKSIFRMKGQRSNSCPNIAYHGQISKHGLDSPRDVSSQVSGSCQDHPAESVGQTSDRFLVAFSNIQKTASCHQASVRLPGLESDISEDVAPNVHNEMPSTAGSQSQVFTKKTKVSKFYLAGDAQHGSNNAVGAGSGKHAILVDSESDENMYCSYCSDETRICEGKCEFHSTEDCQPRKVLTSRTGRSKRQQWTSKQKMLTPMKRFEFREQALTGLYPASGEQKRKKSRFLTTKKCAGLLADPLVRAQAMDMLGLTQKRSVHGFDDNVNASNKRKSRRRMGLSSGDMTDATFSDEDASTDDPDTVSLSSSGDLSIGEDKFETKLASRRATPRPSQEFDRSASALEPNKSRYMQGSRTVSKATRRRASSRTANPMRIVSSSMHHFTVEGRPTSASQMLPPSWLSQRRPQLHRPQLRQTTHRNRSPIPVSCSHDSLRTYRDQSYEGGQRYQFPKGLRTRAEALDVERGGMHDDLGNVISSWVPGRSAGDAGSGFQEGETLFPQIYSCSPEWRQAAYARKRDSEGEGDVLMRKTHHMKTSHDADLFDSDAPDTNLFLWSDYPSSDHHSLQGHNFQTQKTRRRTMRTKRSSPAGQPDTCVGQLLMPFMEAPQSVSAGYFYVPAHVARRTGQADSGCQEGWAVGSKTADTDANLAAEGAFSGDSADTSFTDLDLPTDSSTTDHRSSLRPQAMQRFFKTCRRQGAKWRDQDCSRLDSRHHENDVTAGDERDAKRAFSGLFLHAVTCLPFAVSLLPAVLDWASSEDRLVVLMGVQFLLFFHVVACPLWLLWQHGFTGSRS